MANDRMLVGRRGVLLGAAGLLLGACSSDPKGDKPATTGPVIARPEEGNIVTTDDAAALAEKFNTAFDSGDLSALMKAGGPDVQDYGDFEKRWKRRLATFDKIGCVDGEWYVGVPEGRTRNAAGGVVEFSSTLVFAHQVTGCDGQQVVEAFTCDLRKESTDAPLQVTSIGDVEAFFDPSIWDVVEDIDAIETKHAWIVFRGKDTKRAKAFASRIDEGAARAFDVMPTPRGVTKVFYGLTWPQVDGKLWGGVSIGEADAHAYRHPFLDPSSLASGQKKASSAKGLPTATGRVGLHEGSFARDDFEDIACHEAIHVLAEQWYGSRSVPTPIWAIEGLAEWGSNRPGSGRLLSTDGGRIRSWYPQFAKIARGDYDDFHQGSREYDNYQCSAAVYEYLDQEKGRDAVFETAQAFYGPDETSEESADAFAKRQKELIAAAGKWLRA